MRGQLSYLREAGFDVTVVSAPGPGLDKAGETEQVNTVSVVMDRGISSPFQDLRALWQLYRLFKTLEPDLVNVSTPKAGFLGAIASRLAGVPNIIYTVRGLRFETTSGIKKSILCMCEKIAIACSDRVLCVSESVRQEMVELGLAVNKKTYVLGKGSSNGINLEDYEQTLQRPLGAEKIRCKLNIPLQSRVIGFVGRITRDKGINELVDAFLIVKKEFPDLVLLVVGRKDSAETVEPRIRKELEENRDIILVGHVNDPAPYYMLMDLLVLPTYREGFPNVVLEAGAASIPTVGTYATGVVDAVIDNETGLLSPIGDIEALASNISLLLSNQELARNMGFAAKRYVTENFRSEDVWCRIEEFYWDMLDESNWMK